MLGHDFHEHEADKLVSWYLASHEVVHHFIYLVFDRQVSTLFKSFDLTLHTTAGQALGSMKLSNVDDEKALAFRIDFLVELPLFKVAIVRVVWESPKGQT